MANTFYDLVNAVNNLENSANELRNGNPYYKDNGSIDLANGAFVSLQTGGAGLQIASNGSVGGTLTVGGEIVNGPLTVTGNAIALTSPNNILSVANSIYTSNLYANNLTISGNTVIQGQQFINSNSIVLNAGGAAALTSYLEVFRGPGNTPAFVEWNENAKVWQITSNLASNTLSTILTTANLSSLNSTLSGYSEAVTYVGTVNSPNTVICNLANTNVFDITLANSQYGDVTITFINAAYSTAYPVTLILRQSGFANTVTYANNIVWSGGIKPILSTKGVGFVDVISFITDDGGQSYVGGASGSGGDPLSTANAANTVEVISNFGTAYFDKVLNFANSPTVNVAVTANGANVDLYFNTMANLVSTITVAAAGQANFSLGANVAGNNANLVLVTRNGLLQDVIITQ